jgi:hypothetical protein
MQEARLQAGNAACIPVLYLRYDTARKEQADFFFEESSETAVPTGRSGGGVVVVGGGKCPWCSRTLDEDQTKEDCCPYCRSDLRCPNCSTLLRGTFGQEDVEAFCQKRGCEGVLRRSLRQRMPAAMAAAPTPPRTDRAIMTSHTAPEQAAVGERQQDVFQT